MKPLRPRLLLLGIAGVFFVPLLLAWLVMTEAIGIVPEFRPAQGVLLQPVIPVMWPAEHKNRFQGRWVIVFALPAPCEDACKSQLVGLRQLHIAQGRKQSRVRLLLIMPLDQMGVHSAEQSDREEFLRIYPLFELAKDVGGDLSARLRRSKHQAVEREFETVEGIYLIDPQGRIIMYYDHHTDPNGIHEDLRRLLKHL